MTAAHSNKFRLLDLAGLRFGRLVAIKPTGLKQNNHYLWLCKCDCGNDHVVKGSILNSGGTKSCGCFRSERMKQIRTSHGDSKDGKTTRIYKAWRSMKERCENANHPAYKNYGGRGIAVCERWQAFEDFKSDMGTPPDNLSLDRIDTNGNYEPGNCRWASKKVQVANRRNTIRITVNGETKTSQEWSEIGGTKRGTINKRYHLGYSGWACVFAKNLRRGTPRKRRTKTVACA